MSYGVSKIGVMDQMEGKLSLFCVEFTNKNWIEILVFENHQENTQIIIQEIYRLLLSNLFPKYYSILMIVSLQEKINEGEVKIEFGILQKLNSKSQIKPKKIKDKEKVNEDFVKFREELSNKRVLVRSKLLGLFWNSYIEEMLEDATNQMIVIEDF